MTGIPELNFPAFNAEAARLRALGYEVVNPAEINGGADELVVCAGMTPEQLAEHWRACMRRDIPAMLTCAGLALLPGWEESKGARLEVHIAEQFDMPVCMANLYVQRVPSVIVTFGSVCSGIEAASVAWHPLGWRAAWFAEIEAFPSAVLAHHYPDVPNLGDMTTIAARVVSGEVLAPDILVGGTPCQAFSVAGLRNSLDDARGQLTLSFVDLANAIDTARHLRGQSSAVIVWENVPGVLNTKDNAFGCFLGALAGEDRELEPPGDGRKGRLAWPNAGCVFGPQRAIAWRVLDAQYFGVAQRRRRVFVVAGAGEGFDPTSVLFEQDGLRRDSPPSREARQVVAGTLSSRTTGGGGLGTDFELGGGCSRSGDDGVVGTLEASDGGVDENDAAAGKLVACSALSAPVARSVERPRGDGLDTLIAGTLQANGKAAGSATQQDAESGMLIPIAFSCKDHGADAAYDLAPTLRAGNHDISHANGGQPPAIAFDSRQDCVSSTEVFGALGSSSPQAQAVAVLPFDTTQITSKANVSNPQYGSPCHPLAAGAHAPAVCVTGDVTHTLKAEGFDASEDGTGRGQPIVAHTTQAGALRTNPASGPDGVGVQADVAYTLEARSEVQCAQMGMSVRRLTPRECERLQAYPDDYTLIPWRDLSRLQKKAAKHGVSFESVLREHGKIMREPGGDECPDGPRYKALGNSMCTRNMAWIGRRIDRVLAEANFRCRREIAEVAARNASGHSANSRSPCSGIVKRLAPTEPDGGCGRRRASAIKFALYGIGSPGAQSSGLASRQYVSTIQPSYSVFSPVFIA
eukprot:gene37015-45660_t